MLILSAHADKVRNETRLEFRNGQHSGLLDNFLGVLVSYLAVYDNASIRHLCKAGAIAIHHSLGEEFGLADMPFVTKEDTVVTVDLGRGTTGKDVVLENFFNWSADDLKEFLEFLDEEGISYEYHTSSIDDDESFTWAKSGCKVFSMCIPVKGAYHQDIAFDMDRLMRVREALKRIVCFFVC